MKIVNAPILKSVAIGGSPVSPAFDTSQLFQCSVQVVSLGSTPTFTIKLQASNDAPPAGNRPNEFTPSNWSDIPSATASVTISGAVLIPKMDLCYRYIRAVVSYTSGTGNVVVNLFGVSA